MGTATVLPEPAFIVHCGSTNVVIDGFGSYGVAYACALWHADLHACTPWIEPPLDP